VGDIVSESPGDFISVHPGDFVGIRSDLGVCDGTGQVCEQFFRPGPVPYSVLAAIQKEFNVELVNERDPRFWGFNSEEELSTHVRKTEQRMDLLEMAQAASDETATSLQKRSISSRVSRTHDIVEERIEDELDGYQEYLCHVSP